MKKHLLILVTILMSALMICSCAVAPSTSTDSGGEDTSNSTNSDTESETNAENNDSADKENNSEIGDSTNNDDNNNENSGDTANDDDVNDDTTNDDDVNDDNTNDDTTNDDNTNDGENGNVDGDGTNDNGDGTNDNGDGGENNDANDNTNNDGNDNVNDGNNGDLGNEEPPKEKKPQVNIATQINNAYYKRIYGRYKGDDFPEEYGCYYKVIATYDEFKELFSTTDDPGRAFFNHYYAVIIYEHYQTTNSTIFAGFQDLKGDSIIADYVDYPYIDYPQGSYVKDTKFCIAVPKNEIFVHNDGIVREINVIRKIRDYYTLQISSVSTEKTSDLYSGKTWLIKNSEEFDKFANQYGIHMGKYPLEDRGVYLLAIYSDVYTNRIGFNNFYTDGKNVYISCERINTINLMLEESQTLYFVEIPKSLIEHEMSDEIVVHFLVQKTDYND